MKAWWATSLENPDLKNIVSVLIPRRDWTKAMAAPSTSWSARLDSWTSKPSPNVYDNMFIIVSEYGPESIAKSIPRMKTLDGTFQRGEEG